jgi:chromosome segregation ATPase
MMKLDLTDAVVAADAAVAAVADAMVKEGLKPTTRSVRERMGGGSYTTVLRGMRYWREICAACAADDIPLDPVIIQRFRAQYVAISNQASNDANMRAADAEETVAQLAAELEAMAGRLAEREGELSTAQTQVQQQQGQLSERAGALKELKAEYAAAIDEADKRAASERAQAEELRQEVVRTSMSLALVPGLKAELETARQMMKGSADDVALAKQTAAVAGERAKAQSDRAHQSELREAKLGTQLQRLLEQQAAALALERKLKDEIKTLSKASSSLQARCAVQQSEIARLRQAARKAEARDDDRDGTEPATTARDPRGTA